MQSIAERGINTSGQMAESVTHVSGTKRHLCLGSVTKPDSPGSFTATNSACKKSGFAYEFHMWGLGTLKLSDVALPVQLTILAAEPIPFGARSPIRTVTAHASSRNRWGHPSYYRNFGNSSRNIHYLIGLGNVGARNAELPTELG